VGQTSTESINMLHQIYMNCYSGVQQEIWQTTLSKKWTIKNIRYYC